jgi:ADP-heptose:LPS heptosyltransferase
VSSARILLRTGGLGDVVMALAAAKAMKALTGDQILVLTSERFVDLARCCPDVDRVMTLERLLPQERRAVELGRRLGRLYDLNPATFGIAREHQVDAYLWAAGLEAPPALKQVELNVPETAVRSMQRKAEQAGWRADGVVLHPARGDLNRTWSAQRWTELAQRLGDHGYPVALIGASDPQKGAFSLPGVRAANLIGQLDPLETVGLLRRSAALITTDSGPLHLAAASDAAIVGIFSVVRGANRLPFRHGRLGWNAIAVEPTCPSFPCYRELNRPEVLIPLVESAGSGGPSLARVFGDWCLQPQSRFACLQNEIGVDAVLEALSSLARTPSPSAALAAS